MPDQKLPPDEILTLANRLTFAQSLYEGCRTYENAVHVQHTAREHRDAVRASLTLMEGGT